MFSFFGWFETENFPTNDSSVLFFCLFICLIYKLINHHQMEAHGQAFQTNAICSLISNKTNLFFLLDSQDIVTNECNG